MATDQDNRNETDLVYHAGQATPSLIESQLQDVQSRHGSTTHPYRSLMNDSGFPRCHPVTIPPRSEESYSTECYTRTLLRLGNGTPLWDPVGNVALPKPRLKSSVMIGDVGWFNIRGYFTYYFNIFLPRTDPAQYLCPTNFEPLFPTLQPEELMRNAKHFLPGTTLISPGVNTLRSSTSPLDVTFTVEAREAGILVLPDRASREDLVATARVRDYVLKHALEWYIFMNPGIHSQIICSNGSLCVITGHDKATSWASSAARPYNVTGKARTVRYSNGRWTQNPGVSSQTSIATAQYDIDHCAVFVRTMRIALSTREWTKHLLQNNPSEIVAFYYIPTVPVLGLHALYQKLKERIFTPPDHPVSDECNETVFHPWMVLLRFLLVQFPLARAATIDDSVWNFVAADSDGSLSSTTRALIKVLELHETSEGNRYVTLIPPSISSSNGTTPSKPRKFPFNIPDILKTNFQTRRRRKNIASKLSEVFPGPGVPPFFLSPDPDLAQ